MRAYLRSAMLVACTIVAVPASAQLITFETTPAGFTPLDNTPLLTQYALTGGGSVRFFFDVNTNNSFDAGTDLPAFFEEIGADPIGVSNGFTNSFVGTSDVATPPHGPQLGNWFLRTGNQGPPPPPFIIASPADRSSHGAGGSRGRGQRSESRASSTNVTAS